MLPFLSLYPLYLITPSVVLALATIPNLYLVYQQQTKMLVSMLLKKEKSTMAINTGFEQLFLVFKTLFNPVKQSSFSQYALQ